MGGYGSGVRRRKMRTTEGCMWLDTAAMLRWGWLAVPGSRSGVIGWGEVRDGRYEAEVGYHLVVGESSGSLGLRYALAGDAAVAIDYQVALDTTPCHLGGRRWWFRCPLARQATSCGQRVRKLYLVGPYFGCRCCHALTYRSTQGSDSRVYAAVRGGVGMDATSAFDPMSITQLGFMLKVAAVRQRQSGRRARQGR